jgi:uncharacterized protein (DUF2252 family)
MAFALPTGHDLLHAFDQIEARREFARVELVERRLQRLVASPSGFFRGTPGFCYALLERHPRVRALVGRDTRWIVGDVHLENIGVIAIGHGRLVFDFNDLDETAVASPVLDVVRGAASAALGAHDLGLGPRAAVRAAEGLIVAYLRPLAEAPPRAVRALIERAQQRTSEELLDERCPMQGGARRFVLGKRYLPLLDEEKPVAEALFDAYARQESLPWVTRKLRLEDAAFRVQGTGSLGVRRFIFLARAGRKGDQMLIEAKEMRRSAVVRGRFARARSHPGGEAGRVARGMEALLSESQVGVRALRGTDHRSYLMRLHAPGEDKLALASLQGEDELVALARMIGYRLSQAHERAARAAPPVIDAPATLALALDLASVMARAHLALLVRANSASGA